MEKIKIKKSVFDEPFSAAEKKMEMNRTKRQDKKLNL